MAPARFETIVVGLGAHGSAALYNLAKWGSRVLGIERWEPGHPNGSHHGLTRITRQCYAEGAAYVPLLKYSFAAYKALERESKRRLFTRTGVLNVGEPLVAGALASAREHGLPHQMLDANQAEARFPGLRVPDGCPVLFEEAGGILEPEAMVAAHCAVAAYHGATIRTRERVLSWEPLGDGGVAVVTDAGARYEADRLVLSPGAWIGKLVPELAGLVTPQRVTVGWFQPLRPELFTPERLPVWLLQMPGERHLYGFPIFGGEPGFKIGNFPPDGATDPDTLDRAWRGAADEAPLRAALERFFPEAAGPFLRGGVCMFANTPDGHFLVDTHPRYPQVVLCSACSGHGFKLSPAIGLALAELARHGSCEAFEKEMGLHRLDPARPGVADALAKFQ
ncbi:N-methyltryptophan oxidase [Raphidocelis subcapitata]|uniref:N-methyltryptophan oxidase n=1 Tax=Raphidocelis subcapitata TaxID=307507 RepID=A0A2V0NQ46_9CHLO|nr:N-methyltryptophan oxidase [Raphidocelis subcapitata]|eukprot:GBF88702.1 N-methyltryptophan oxidase [Raphidocelis subcapitata]